MEKGEVKQTNMSEMDQLKHRCYTKALENEWATGRVALRMGNPIAAADRLNPDSIGTINHLDDLKAFFRHGNWCLGCGVIHKNLLFLQQVDGGDEWATYKITPEEIFQFESISFEDILKTSESGFDHLLVDLLSATDHQCKTLTYTKS